VSREDLVICVFKSRGTSPKVNHKERNEKLRLFNSVSTFFQAFILAEVHAVKI
jgi:hypothetical protein